MKLEYRPELDGLRALACLSVVCVHSDAPWLPGGALGVDVFFVLSGFLITSILHGEWNASGAIDCARFWRKRALRLYPALLLMLAVTAPVYALLRPNLGLVPFVSALAAALYVSDLARIGAWFGHTWSLSVEAQFYLIWPVVLSGLLTVGVRRAAWVLGLAWLALTAARFLPWMEAQPLYFSPWHCSGLLLGSALALNPPRASAALAWLGVAVLLGVLALATNHGLPFIQISAPLAEVATALLLVGLPASPKLRAAFSWRPAVWVGLVSYSLYLWHVPIVRALDGLPWNQKLPLVLLVSIPVAALSYWMLERRTLSPRPAPPRRSSRAAVMSIPR